MDSRERQIHLTASRESGQDASCGVKIDHGGEERATKTATALTLNIAAKEGGTKVLEAYPCFWCQGWHIGRKMTAEERIEILAMIARGEGVQ